MSTFAPKLYALDMANYLKSRFHPGKPHIGTVGTLPPVEELSDTSLENPFDENETEPTGKETSKTSPTFTFVPNHASYAIPLHGQTTSTSTRIIFFLRTGEGTEEDITPQDNRPKEYILTKDELENSFRKYQIDISFDQNTGKQIIEIKINEKKIDLNATSSSTKFKIKELPDTNPVTTFLEISDESNPFMIQMSERIRGLQIQKYKILIKREIITKDDRQIVRVVVRNLSSPTIESTHPRRKWKKDNSGHETESDCLDRYSSQISETELFHKWTPKIFEMEERWMPGGNTYGRLLEFEMEESNIDCRVHPFHDSQNEKYLEDIVNVVYDEHLELEGNQFKGTIKFQDFLLFKENIPSMALGLKPSQLFSKLGFSDDLSKAFVFPNLYKFQEDSIVGITESHKKPTDSATLISARTGGGKTEAFMFPILNYCIEKIHENKDKQGTKAIIFYPTKALANDQASRIINLLYTLNKLDLPRKITIGILHGDVPKSEEDPKWDASQFEGIPFECPACKIGTLVPRKDNEVFCNNCNEILDFVFAFTRRPIYSNTPDILITNPDTLQFDLMMRPQHHGIFGRKIFACKNCGRSYAGQKRTCFCGNADIVEQNPTPPKFIVFLVFLSLEKDQSWGSPKS